MVAYPFLWILGECRSASSCMASFFLEVGISLAATTFDSTMIGQLAFFGGGSLAQISFGCRAERSQISSVLEDQVHRRMKALQGFLRHCPKKEPPLCLQAGYMWIFERLVADVGPLNLTVKQYEKTPG